MISGHRLRDRHGKGRYQGFLAQLRMAITMEGWKGGRGEDWNVGRLVFPD